MAQQDLSVDVTVDGVLTHDLDTMSGSLTYVPLSASSLVNK